MSSQERLACITLGCTGAVIYHQAITAFGPCDKCGKRPQDPDEWIGAVLDESRGFPQEDKGKATAWLLSRREEAEEQQLLDSLTEEDRRVIGEYSDIMNRDGVEAAEKFLEDKPQSKNPFMGGLLQTARLLRLAGLARRIR